MYISLCRALLEKNTAIFIISLLLILPIFISQQSHAQDTLCVGGTPNGTIEGVEECDDDNVVAGDGCTNCWLDCEITVEKVANPEDDTLFPFLRLTISIFQDPVFDQFDLSDPSSPTNTFSVPFLSGTFIAELPPAGWELEDIDCGPENILELQQLEIPDAFQEEFERVRSGNLVFAVCILGGSATCTYTNRQIEEERCNITIEKEAPEGGDTEFPFNIFSDGLDEDFDLSDGQTIPFNDLPLDTTFTITETVPDQWSLDSIVCDGDAVFDESVNEDSVEITCNSTGDISCTFTNSRIPPVTNVPTLSEWGLIAMAGILGIVGFMVIRRRKVTV